MNTSLILDNILFLSIVCILYYKLQIIYLEYMTYNPQQSNQSITHCSNFGIGHSMPLFGIVNYAQTYSIKELTSGKGENYKSLIARRVQDTKHKINPNTDSTF